MPTLTIIVVDPPSDFAERGPVHLLLPTKAGLIAGERVEEGMRFQVDYQVKLDKAGVPQPSGELVQRQNDGRRFVYLGWLDDGHTMFRRLKVFFGSGDDLSRDSVVRVNGRDRKGGPACATAVVIP